MWWSKKKVERWVTLPNGAHVNIGDDVDSDGNNTSTQYKSTRSLPYNDRVVGANKDIQSLYNKHEPEMLADLGLDKRLAYSEPPQMATDPDRASHDPKEVRANMLNDYIQSNYPNELKKIELKWGRDAL